MPAVPNSASLRLWTRLENGAAGHFVEGEVRARTPSGLARRGPVARPPPPSGSGSGAPAALPGSRDPRHRIRRPRREPRAGEAPRRRGERPDRAGGRPTRSRPGGDQHRDQRGRRHRSGRAVRRARPPDRRAHRVQPPDGHRRRLQGGGRRRAPFLLQREPHGAVRGQVLPHRQRRLHDVRGRDPGVVGAPRLGHRPPRRLHVGDQRVLLGLEDPAGPVHPLLRDEPPQGPPHRASHADLRQQQRQGLLRPAADLLRPVGQPGPHGGPRVLPEARARDRGDVPLRPDRGLAGRAGRVLPPRRGGVARLQRGPLGRRASATRRSSRRGWSSRRTSPA